MIPISSPIIAKNAKKYINDCLSSGWVSSRGSYVKKFEKKFAQYTGTKYASATSGGTAAIHLSLAALNIKHGDEVILPAFTMIAAAFPVLYCGATPILVDGDSNGCIDVTKIEEKVTSKTRAIIAVHVNGYPVDMAPLLKIAKKYSIAVIEDAAEAHGAAYRMPNGIWKKVGSMGDFGCFSFYGNKIITAGEGGMVTTNNKSLAERVEFLRNLARTPKKHFYHQEVAFAYRMSNLQAALGLAELEQIDEFLKKKYYITKRYNQLLSDIKDITLPNTTQGFRTINWQYSILIQDGAKRTRDQLARYLQKHDIETRNFVVPLHMQPAFLKKGYFIGERYPVSEFLASHGISIPSGLAITNDQIDFVSQIIHQAFQS